MIARVRSMPPVIATASSAAASTVARPLRLRIGAYLAACAMFCGAPPSTAAAQESSAKAALATPALLVLGDSISAEYGLERDKGWVRLLDARLKAQHYDYTIVNASISGETTSGGLARLDELLTRVKPAVVIVELGGNDALRGLDLATTQKNLDAIVARSQAAHAAVLIVGMQIPPNYGKAYADRFTTLFKTTAQARKTALTPFFFAGFADRLDLFQPDRIHPTADAQPRLLDNVWPDLKPLLKSR